MCKSADDNDFFHKCLEETGAQSYEPIRLHVTYRQAREPGGVEAGGEKPLTTRLDWLNLQTLTPVLLFQL